MITLGIDTSSDVVAGVARDGLVLAAGVVADRRAHAEQLMPLVRAQLAEAGLTLADVGSIAVGVGPGSFTGLRVGVVTATTLGAVLDRPVRGVCSLDAVAAAWTDAPEEFVVVSDARRHEVYWARYADGRRVTGPFVTPASQVPDLRLAGPGATLVRSAVAGPAAIDAGVLAAAASGLPDEGLEPLYLRRPDAEVSTKRKSTIVQPRLAFGGRR